MGSVPGGWEFRGFPYGLKHVAAPSWLLLSSKNRPWWLKALAYLKLSLGSSIYRVWKLIDTPYRAMWYMTYWGFLRAQIRRIFLDGYGVLVVRIVIFKYLCLSSRMRNMEMEPDIENMTMNEYLEYEAAKERQLWDDVRSRKSPTNYDKADVDSFHRNKSKTFSYPYSHNLTPPHPCFLPVQPYPMNYLVSTNESNNDDDLEEDQEDDGNDMDSFDIWDITVEDVEQNRQFYTPNIPNVIKNVIQPLISKTLHTTPPNEDYVALATKSILDDLLEEFGDEILNVTMVDEG
ncbi:hypothetical protein Tco_0155239 [Tanacetum coccineum]